MTPPEPVAPRLVEREQELTDVAEVARDAMSGSGCVVLVSGEAGIGKSSVVNAVRGRIPAEARLLVGHCDDLSTARTLGPFRDLIGSVGAELSAALRDGTDRDRILTALHAELDWAGRPTVLVIEDVHWADDATLDVLRYLVRRVDRLPLVLMLTYRDDELGRQHPLLQLLGMVGGQARRLALRPLSAAAVRELCAGTGLGAAEVLAVTSGNPLFVSEVLAAGPGAGVSRTVTDVVLARLGRLDDPVREAVEQLSVVPTAIERQLVDALVPGGLAALAAAEERGFLTVTPRQATFRHELTRRAIADAVPAGRQALLNARVLAALIDDPAADVARIVHHAAAAGDHGAVVRFGPTAARSAAALGAHREAAAHYRLVLAQAEAFAPAERAALLDGYAVMSYMTGESDCAVPAQQQAIALYRELGASASVGAGLRWLSRMHWIAGDRPAAEATAAAAVAELERVGDRRLLAIAYSNRAQLDMLARRSSAAVPMAERAVALARETDDVATLCHALNNLGSALWALGRPDGRGLVEESLRIALEINAFDDAARAYTNLAWPLLDQFQLDDAQQYIDAGIAFADGAEHGVFIEYLRIGRARLEMHRCEWDAAIRSAEQAVTGHAQFRYQALTVTGRIHCRLGAASGAGELATAVELAREANEPQWLGPVAAASAEAAWLRADHAAIVAVAAAPYAELFELDDPSLWPELAFWLGKAGHPVRLRPSANPYGLLAAGDWREAADIWQATGCRYEYALALAESAEPHDQLAAIEVLDALGAKPLARILRDGLRRRGITTIPRGPVMSTQQNPAGLTGRQLEVLELVADGLTSAEIADRLVVSIRTVENHVSAVLGKLGVHSRAEAVSRSRAFLRSR